MAVTIEKGNGNYIMVSFNYGYDKVAAIKKALLELKVERDKVEIEILDPGNKGFLNFIGVRPAKIKVKVKRDYIKEANMFLKKSKKR